MGFVVKIGITGMTVLTVFNLCGLPLNVNCDSDQSSTIVYETKYDDINLNEILANERLLQSYVNCLLNEGPCTPDGQELKETLPDAISTDCQRCSEKQKTGSTKVMHYLIDNNPDDWNKLEKIYDSEGNYRKDYLSEIGKGDDKTAK